MSRDRDRRVVNPPVRYTSLVNLIVVTFNVYESDGDEPQSYKQALKSKFWNLWHKAMKDEMLSLKVNCTWLLVHLPTGASIVDCRWLYKIKNEVDGLKYKSRLVAKGFTQQEGVNYTGNICLCCEVYYC